MVFEIQGWEEARQNKCQFISFLHSYSFIQEICERHSGQRISTKNCNAINWIIIVQQISFSRFLNSDALHVINQIGILLLDSYLSNFFYFLQQSIVLRCSSPFLRSDIKLHADTYARDRAINTLRICLLR